MIDRFFFRFFLGALLVLFRFLGVRVHVLGDGFGVSLLLDARLALGERLGLLERLIAQLSTATEPVSRVRLDTFGEMLDRM